MKSIRGKIMDITPVSVLNWWCRRRPKFAIELLCHWVSDRNPVAEERWQRALAPTWVPVAKKMSRLAEESILNLLNQDKSLWKAYMPGIGVRPFPSLPYILLEIMHDLGGSEGRKKVLGLVARCRVTLGGQKQGEILEHLKADTVIELFEELPEFEVRMRLTFNNPETVAFWLDHWDLKMRRIDQPEKSAYWLGQLPGERAFQIQQLMRNLEFRRKYEPIETIYDYRRYDYRNEWKEAKNSLAE